MTEQMDVESFRKLANIRGTRIHNLDSRRIPESEVNKVVANHFYFHPNVCVYRRNTGAVKTEKRFIRFGQAGMADFWGVIGIMKCPHCGRVTGRGVHLEIECKKYGGKLTQNQRDFLETMRQLGAVTVVAIPVPTKNDPSGFNAIREELERVDKKPCSSCASRRADE